jgi:hypothetical protein
MQVGVFRLARRISLGSLSDGAHGSRHDKISLGSLWDLSWGAKYLLAGRTQWPYMYTRLPLTSWWLPALSNAAMHGVQHILLLD